MPKQAIQILLANPRGFCAGVEMAVECLDRALEQFGAPVFVYHYIVHNRFIVEEFERRGALFVNELKEVPNGAPVLFSAHGVAPDIRLESRNKGLRIVDTTCPLVTKVHREVRQFVQNGYTTLLIGHRGHDEVVGILGECDGIILIETGAEAETVSVADESRVAYTTQTTLSLDDCSAILDVLRRRFPNLQGPPVDDICYATQNRQRAVRALASVSDTAIVIGSQSSSNTLRLVEIAKSAGIPAYRIDGPEEIDWEWVANTKVLLITAGASVPENLVQRTVQALKTRLNVTVEEQESKPELVHFPLPELVAASSR
ncbi:MAG TPA: 4-hydroxy-3-methylbut-2-enyl diphosphate reductase [Bryobacteraceae bacterium]|nr:4-hydroxy-3-methylbut-2-enyl diphosphate reductase [Bryobacteraceae bacterium]